MAELIDKKALLSLVNREKEMSSSEYSVGYIDAINDVNNMIDVLSTTTEAEIRAMAISDFLQFVYDNASNEEYANEDGWAMSDLIDLEYKFVKQLKEE